MVIVKEGIYWVGTVDWSIRNFHGYVTHRGTSYNSYLVVDEKVALIDFVKAPFAEEQLARISEVIDPKKVDYIVANHAEPDHSGSIRRVMEVCPNAEVIATERCINTLLKYYGGDLKITPIEKKPTIKLGKRSLAFVPVPMAHWPDSMVSYMPEEKLLFSNDAFGQHLASSGRFDDEVDEAELFRHGAKYYANILLPYSPLVLKLLERVAASGLAIEVIAPDHGPVWRKDLAGILGRYGRWAAQKPTDKAVVVYATMWKSTEWMARAMAEGIAEGGLQVKLMNMDEVHRSDVAFEILEAGALCAGSPTLNNNLLPQMADVLTYLKGLRPAGLVGSAFGSFGWSGESVKQVQDCLGDFKVETVGEAIRVKHAPDRDTLALCRQQGRLVAAAVKERIARG